MVTFGKSPVIGSVEVEVRLDAKEVFIDWQAQLNGEIVKAPGFVSLEFLSPSPSKWVVVQRFSTPEDLKSWQDSKSYQDLLASLQPLTQVVRVLEPKQEPGNITEMIVTEVNPGMEAQYRAWSTKVHHIEAKFPGFRGVYVQAPQGEGRYWITLLQFDSLVNLDKWLQSNERDYLLKEAYPLVASLESHRVISPYAGWFSSLAKTGEVPPVWKQTMLVLLVLFPIVALELKYLNPQIAFLNSSLATFIGNAISVSLISFPMMPIAIHYLGWWLTTRSPQINLAGTLLVLLLYTAEIALFWNFL